MYEMNQVIGRKEKRERGRERGEVTLDSRENRRDLYYFLTTHLTLSVSPVNE